MVRYIVRYEDSTGTYTSRFTTEALARSWLAELRRRGKEATLVHGPADWQAGGDLPSIANSGASPQEKGRRS